MPRPLPLGSSATMSAFRHGMISQSPHEMKSLTHDELLVCFRHIVFSLLAGSYIHLVLVFFFHFAFLCLRRLSAWAGGFVLCFSLPC
jgi:hypothetical protein